MNEDLRIFTETSENLGLLYNSYKDLPEIINKFLKVSEDAVDKLLEDPKNNRIDLKNDISKFKNDINKKFEPSPIQMNKIKSLKQSISSIRSTLDKILNKYAKLRNRVSFGGNYLRAIVKRPKVYSKEVDYDSYSHINSNIRNVDRALDWVEKIIIDLYNMIDQDMNILTIVDRVYNKSHIYESGDIYFNEQEGRGRILNITENDYFDILKSDVDENFQSKGYRLLSDFNKVYITNDLCKKYKDQGKLVKWMRDQNEKYDDMCYMWIDNEGNYVGAITYDFIPDKDGYVWLSGIDVAYKYTGYGIGKQLLEESIKGGVNALCVQIDNFIAMKMYKDRGFIISEESQKKVDEGKSKIYDMILPENINIKYNPPIQYDKLPEHLKDDPIYSWISKTGIELIHKKPTSDILDLTWINWNRMSDNQKRISDEKSKELFGIDNRKHYFKLIREYGTSLTEITSYNNDILDEDINTFDEKYTLSNLPGEIKFDKEIKSRHGKVLVEGVGIMEGTGINGDDLDWIEQYLMEEGETFEKPPALNDDNKPKEKKLSMPKQTDAAEVSKNGVRRKKLYIAFIEWCKEYNSKNTFGSIFDKDAFKVSYPFVPDEMRYFYRLANPMLCVLSGDLTFFPVAELRKLNSRNSHLDQMMIFAATPNDMRVFNRKDKKVYRGTDENGALTLHEVLGDTFDTYIQKMINKGDILNAPLEDNTEVPSQEENNTNNPTE